MYNCRPNMMGPIVHPTKCCVKNLYSTTEVPHIHPSHTTYVNNQQFQHKHYFPHTDSMVDSVSHQHFNCGPGGPGMGGQPGQVMGAQTGPGYGQMGMPGQVMGAQTNAGYGQMGMPGQVMGAQQGPGMGQMGPGGMPGKCNKNYGYGR
ncbi:spore coat protein [Sutcliffiella horikoshii]|uniref:spore coat protein n=1 Tax=Sutcliffiella horikoshii TaxID=79883 RepID=UPI001CBCEA00|nr:spore coat protein [Sutcliffiella horikoshii]UAL45715.1 spore coat protein [Sutcliffiella horikoshii]